MRQESKPLYMNVDKSMAELSLNESSFLLNYNIQSDGSPKLGKQTKYLANSLACLLEHPAGETYGCGSFYSPLTNEWYQLFHNSNSVHFITVTSEKECRVVYDGPCIPISASPEHYVAQFRCYLKYDRTCKNQHGKQLVFTLGFGPMYQIDVEASIATKSFTTDFFFHCSNECELIHMDVPKPCYCPIASWIPLPETETGLTNYMLDQSFQFRYVWEYYDGRRSIFSSISSTYYQDSKGCFSSSFGYSRCLKLRIPVGNPLVEKIHIYVQKNGDGIWLLVDTVEKYKKYNNNQQYWYERGLAELNGYSIIDCSFDYIFCNDKLGIPADPKEASRVNNPMPRDVQCLIPIKNSIGLINYVKGVCPIDRVEADKFKISPVCDEDNGCEVEYATVTVRAIFHNYHHNRNQFIYRLNGDAENANDDTTDRAYFGGLNPALDGGFETGYEQFFTNKTRGLIVYVEGTQYWAEMRQWKSQEFFRGTKEYWPVVPKMGSASTRNRWRRAINGGEFFYSEAKIKMPKGTKGFLRLTSHQANVADESKSTFVSGLFSIYQYKGDLNLGSGGQPDFEELEFDTSNGDIELDKAFIIKDNAIDSGGENKANAVHGYVKDKDGRPVEGAEMFVSISGVSNKMGITDHNGFYHFYIQPGARDNITINVKAETDCNTWATIQSVSFQGEVGANLRKDITIANDIYNQNLKLILKQKVIDCEGNPVSGVSVALSGNSAQVTDGSGIARFTVRNYSSRNRVLKTVVMNNKGCFNIDCFGQCNPSMPTSIMNAPTCFLGNPTRDMPVVRINKDAALNDRAGLKSGGRYGMGWVAEGDNGYLSGVNTTGYIDLPKTQEKGKQSFCQFKYESGNIVLPKWVKCIKIVRTENLNGFRLQWKVDKIERTTDNKIKLTIQSLNDYNEKYFFKTNTTYQFVKNDRVEFIFNGDGKVFVSSLNGVLNYQILSPFHDSVISGNDKASADFFNQILIEDDGRLSSLKEGAIIELQRPVLKSEFERYYEVCAIIPVVDGRLIYPTGTFNTFDTFLVNRQIGNGPALELEHHSPSDFWGERVSDIGRVHVVNEFENERRYGRNISINSGTIFNYFGDFEKPIPAPEQGDIIGANIKDGKILMAIAQNDSFIGQVGDDFVRVNSSGAISAAPVDSIVSDPQPKISDTFGCRYEDIGGILFGESWAMWPDVNRVAYVLHDYDSAKNISAAKFQSYFSEKFQRIKQNSAVSPYDRFRFATGWDKQSGAVFLTMKRLRDSGINNSLSVLAQENETVVFYTKQGEFGGMVSFTPESYGWLAVSSSSGAAFLCTLNGQSYFHPIKGGKFNEFFGVRVDTAFAACLNESPEKVKRGNAIEIQCNSDVFAAEIRTNNIKFVSEIPPALWVRLGDKSNAAFLSNANTPTGIHEGTGTVGYWMNVLFVVDNTDEKKYGTIDDEKRIAAAEIDSIYFKYIPVEQSGLTSQ